MIRLRPSGDRLRFFLAGAFVEPLGRPRVGLAGASVDSRARVCFSTAISASMSESKLEVFMRISLPQDGGILCSTDYLVPSVRLQIPLTLGSKRSASSLALSQSAGLSSLHRSQP